MRVTGALRAAARSNNNAVPLLASLAHRTAVLASHHMSHLHSAPAAEAAADPINPPEQDQQWTSEQCHFMRLALEQAKLALTVHREVPIGCVIVRDGQVIGSGFNMTNHTRNATRHAELEAIDRILADHGGDVRKVQFHRCQLYVTVEPCIMCAGALSLLGLKEVIYGAANDKFGGCGSIVPVHEHGCGSCGASSTSSSATGPHGGTFAVQAGLYAQQAVKLLQDFYVAGNPAAPKPHRPIMEVPPWEQKQQQQQQQQQQPPVAEQELLPGGGP